MTFDHKQAERDYLASLDFDRDALDARCAEIRHNIIERHEDRDRYCRQRIFLASLEACRSHTSTPQLGASDVAQEDRSHHEPRVLQDRSPSPAGQSVADSAGADPGQPPACAIGGSRRHEPEVRHLMDAKTADQIRAILRDEDYPDSAEYRPFYRAKGYIVPDFDPLAANAEQLSDFWAAHSEAAQPVHVIPGPTTTVTRDEDGNLTSVIMRPAGEAP